jgi:UDP:flavonoid glycosyltransferase YjiC (YdhE family)
MQSSALRVVTEALLDLDMDVVCTVGTDEAAVSLPRHERLHVERYIPQSAVLPYCDLVVCHAGSGTMLGALSHGLPMLLLPQSADQFDNADRCVEQGVAIRLMPDEVDREAILTTVRALLSGDYAQAAAEMRDQLLALPPAASAVERCEALVSRPFAKCRL